MKGMNYFYDKKILITGAAGGFGGEFYPAAVD